MGIRWKCFQVDSKPFKGDSNYRPGAMWFGERSDNPNDYSYWPSKEFLESDRLPLFVLLPSNGPWLLYFFVDMKPTDEASEEGWKYTGTIPSITITPSINCAGTYHGWVQNGYVTPDCEGRTYPAWEKFGEPNGN